ncbi:hypothetical protein PsorP6_006365 [Peronosclerospora sorghi]|uniref:Uncharacterized protein n=1 Tax=Peronosclerospora sorghi TaxID=230839 RepID=A0ACC0W4X6_9STRA|nr:hypothetical protein PsorP6_006365 [Peronosclerospora sorghi]
MIMHTDLWRMSSICMSHGRSTLPPEEHFASYAHPHSSLKFSMQLVEFLFVIMMVLFGTHDCRVSALKCHVKSTGSATIADESMVPIRNHHLKGSRAHATDVVPEEEERAGGYLSSSTRIGGSNAITTNNTPEETDRKQVTMTTYNGDGVVQKVEKWWHHLLSHDEKSTRRLRS